MSMDEYSPTTITPLLLRNVATSVFIFADKSLLNLSEKYKLLEFIRYLLVSSFLFFLRLVPSLLPSFDSNPNRNQIYCDSFKVEKHLACVADSGIARSLSQLLSIVGDIPVNSPKYQVVRSLAEKLIYENHREDVHALREVNRTVLSTAFARTIKRLEVAVLELGREQAGNGILGSGPVRYGLNRVVQAVRCVGWGREEIDRPDVSAHKLAAELLWLCQIMTACGLEEEAVHKWASASNLAWLSLSAEPRLQGLLVKVSALLFHKVKNVGIDEVEESKKEKGKETKVKMLLSWLPLLCRGSNGVDVPVLSICEKAELEKELEEMIEMVEQQEVKEQILSLWLHHFTYCPTSDWPNLHSSYARWYSASRRLVLLQ